MGKSSLWWWLHFDRLSGFQEPLPVVIGRTLGVKDGLSIRFPLGEGREFPFCALGRGRFGPCAFAVVCRGLLWCRHVGDWRRGRGSLRGPVCDQFRVVHGLTRLGRLLKPPLLTLLAPGPPYEWKMKGILMGCNHEFFSPVKGHWCRDICIFFFEPTL